MKKALRQYILDNFDSALENGRIQVYYQPVIRTISGTASDLKATIDFDTYGTKILLLKYAKIRLA